MRVTFVLPFAGMISGGTRVIGTYAERLQRRGHDVVVVSTTMGRARLRDLAKFILFREGRLALGQVRRPMLENFDIDHRRLDHESVLETDVPDADVVVATWWTTVAWVLNLSRRKGAKVHFVQGDDAEGGAPEERLRSIFASPLHRVVVSNWLQQSVVSRAGDPHVSLVPNSVDLQFFGADRRDRQSQPTVGFVYSNAPCKGCDVALEACRLARMELTDLRIIAFGRRIPSKRMLLPLNVEYSLRPEQHLLKEIYSSCDTWLFPSRSEGFGLPILEAMACRTPVIATPAGAAPELLSNGGGVLVRRNAPEEMARAIVHLCSLRNSEWQQLSDAAYRTALSYTWEDATDLFEDALLTAISRSSTGEINGERAGQGRGT